MNQQPLSLLLFQIHETIESINQLKIQRDFMLSFSRDPKGYIQDWLKSQSRDLKVRCCFFIFKRGRSLSRLKVTLKRLAAFCKRYDLEMKCRRVISERKTVKLFLKPFIYTSDQSMSSPIKKVWLFIALAMQS